MDDVKDKMKGFVKKVTPSSSSKFKGQGRVLGSSSPSSPSPANSRLIPPTRPNPTPQNPYPNPNPKPKPSESGPIPSHRPDPDPAPAFECPICSSSFPSEADVSAHVDLCLSRGSDAGAPAEGDVAGSVAFFVSGEPSEESVEIVLRLLRNVVREPGNDKFRRIRMGNPKIKEAAGEAKGGRELLESVEFRIAEEEGEMWATMAPPTEGTVAGIKEAVSLLERWKENDSNDDGSAAVEPKPNAVIETKPIDRQVNY